MEDIKKTIEFANSKDKLEIDIKYEDLKKQIDEREKFYNIIGIVFCLSFISIIVSAKIHLEVISGICAFIVFLCMLIVFIGISSDILSETDFQNAYNLFCETIDYSKDIYLKVYESNISISYFSKKDNSYETKMFIDLTDSYEKYVRYIYADNFKIVGRLMNDEYKITLYMPVKYNEDYLEFAKQQENI